MERNLTRQPSRPRPPCRPLGGIQRVYIAGPMSGFEDSNFQEFEAVASRWRASGYDVVSPAELDDGDTTRPWTYYMRRDLGMLLDCDMVAVLNGWSGSRGARLEVLVASLLGLNIVSAYTRELICPGLVIADEPTPEPDWETVLEEAERLVGGPRGDLYGHPIEDFTRTGRLWAAILGIAEVPPEKVALCMAAMKISRECNKPKRDNRTDIAGYIRCLDMIATHPSRDGGT